MNSINPWSYSYIRQLADEATILARQEGLRPALASEVIKTYKHSHRFNIPFLGDYVPEGWMRIDYFIAPLFVDTTGRAKHGDPAITQQEFFQRAIQNTHSPLVIGYGVIEMGQTQALVATYKRKENP